MDCRAFESWEKAEESAQILTSDSLRFEAVRDIYTDEFYVRAYDYRVGLYLYLLADGRLG